MTPADGEYPKTVVLRDGAHLVLRPSTAADGGALRALAARLPDAGGLAVLAWDGGHAAGVALLAPRGPDDGRVAALAVAVDPAYRGRRLGTWLLLDAVHVAAGLGLASLVVEPPADADDYRAALRRLDFVPEATAAGSPVRWVKALHHGWTDF